MKSSYPSGSESCNSIKCESVHLQNSERISRSKIAEPRSERVGKSINSIDEKYPRPSSAPIMNSSKTKSDKMKKINHDPHASSKDRVLYRTRFKNFSTDQLMYIIDPVTLSQQEGMTLK